MKKKPAALFILVLLILCFLTLPASATNATKMCFSDLGQIGPQQIVLYEEGIEVGVYNTTECNITLPDKDFMVIIKPELKSSWFNPQNFVSTFFGYIQTYWEALLLLCILVGVILVMKK